MQQEEMTAWLRLLLAPGAGPVLARQLLQAFGLPGQIWCQSESALAAVVGPARARALQAFPADWPAQLDRTWQWLQAGTGAEGVPLLLSLADPRYPRCLLDIPDPPVLLFALASPALAVLDADAWQQALGARCLAMVGSRNPTPAGLHNARAFAHELAEQGCCIVSGLALGIDGAAHEGALEGWRAAPGGVAASPCASIAVVGTGLDRVYPRRHRDLAHKLARHGLLLSEHLPGTPALAHHFPRRNRLIAGLSRGTLVVEAAAQSGSLITARLAAEQGREVMALPGSIHSPQSRGCHALIRQGACLVENAADVLEALGWSGARPVMGASAVDEVADAGERHAPLLRALGFDPTDLQSLLDRTGMDAAELQVRLLELELEGQLARLPGARFQRLALS